MRFLRGRDYLTVFPVPRKGLAHKGNGEEMVYKIKDISPLKSYALENSSQIKKKKIEMESLLFNL